MCGLSATKPFVLFLKIQSFCPGWLVAGSLGLSPISDLSHAPISAALLALNPFTLRSVLVDALKSRAGPMPWGVVGVQGSSNAPGCSVGERETRLDRRTIWLFSDEPLPAEGCLPHTDMPARRRCCLYQIAPLTFERFTYMFWHWSKSVSGLGGGDVEFYEVKVYRYPSLLLHEVKTFTAPS